MAVAPHLADVSSADAGAAELSVTGDRKWQRVRGESSS